MDHRLLIVEDNPVIGASLQRAFATTSAHARWVSDGAAAMEAVRAEPFDLVLLDLSLPDIDGFAVAEQIIQDRPGIPIIMVTARNEEADVVSGLRLGAVDYVAKPFRLAELMARVDARLREVRTSRPGSVRIAGDVRVDVASHRVWRGGAEVTLSPREFALLDRLTSAPGEVVTRSQLMAEIWGHDWVGTAKTLDVHVSSLRRRLGEAPGTASRIVAVRAVGYRFEVA